MNPGRRASILSAVPLLLAAPVTSASELSLTVFVRGLLPDTDEPLPIKKATVRIETAEEPLERPTNTHGKASFRLEAGTVSVIVTGQDTAEHWATGTCSVELESDLVVSFVLDLEESTRKCEREKSSSNEEEDSTADDDSKDTGNADDDSKGDGEKENDSKDGGGKDDS